MEEKKCAKCFGPIIRVPGTRGRPPIYCENCKPTRTKREQQVRAVEEVTPTDTGPVAIFAKAMEQAQELVTMLEGYDTLKQEVEELRAELARVQARNLRLIEDNRRMSDELETLQSRPRKTLRVSDLPKVWKELATAALSQGWAIEHTAGNHLKWIPMKGEPYVSSNTPSDHRTILNTRAALIQRGLSI